MFEVLVGLGIAGLVGYVWRRGEKEVRQVENYLDTIKIHYQTLMEDYNELNDLYLDYLNQDPNKRLLEIQEEIARQLAAVNAPDTGGL